METANNINTNNNNSQRMIQEAIRKIALGRSFDRANMSPAGTGGVGTARMIHGYVAKIHDDPNDEEYEEYAGTIDVGEFPDETASSEPIIHKGVLLSGLKDNSGGFLIVPTLFSDVTIVSDAGTKYMYVLNFSHADVLQLNAHNETIVGQLRLRNLIRTTMIPRTMMNCLKREMRLPPNIPRTRFRLLPKTKTGNRLKLT